MEKTKFDFPDAGSEYDPLNKNWLNLDKCNEILNTPHDPSNENQIFLVGVCTVFKAGLESNIEKFSKGIELLEEADEKGSSSASLELAWLSCFTEKVKEGQRYIEQAEEKFSKKILPCRIKAYKKWIEGDLDQTLNQLKENISKPNSEYRDEAALDQFENDSVINPFGGYLCQDENFGNLHHPLEISSDNAQFQLYLLEESLNEKENPELKFQAALIAFFLNKYELALSWLNDLANKGESGDVLSLLGYVMEKSGNINEAVSHYQKALALEFHPLASTNLANIFLNRGNLFLAEKLLSETLSIAPEYSEALSLFGRALCFQKGKQEEALDYLKRAISNDSEVPDYHLNYCLGLLQTGSMEKLQGEWSFHKKYMQSYTEKGNMRKLFNIVISGSKDPFQNVGVAEMLNQNGFHEAAKFFVAKAWKRAYTIEEKKKKEFSYFTGLHAAQCGEFETALEAYRSWEKFEKKGSVATVCVAMALNDLHQCEEALKEIETCDIKDPKVAPIRAGILWKLNQNTEAVRGFVESLQGKDVPFTAFFNGMKCALQSGDDLLEKIMSLGKEKWPDSTHQLALRAMGYITLKNTKEAINILEEQLKIENEFQIPTVKENAGPMEENVVSAFNVLGFAYLDIQDQESFEKLISWLNEFIPQGAAEWEILRAESFRRNGQYEAGLKSISSNNTLPTGKFTKALIFENQENVGELKSMISEILENPWILKNFYHLEGDMLTRTKSMDSNLKSQLNPA